MLLQNAFACPLLAIMINTFRSKLDRARYDWEPWPVWNPPLHRVIPEQLVLSKLVKKFLVVMETESSSPSLQNHVIVDNILSYHTPHVLIFKYILIVSPRFDSCPAGRSVFLSDILRDFSSTSWQFLGDYFKNSQWLPPYTSFLIHNHPTGRCHVTYVVEKAYLTLSMLYTRYLV